MEMEMKNAKEENLRNSVPFVKQLSIESNKAKTDTNLTINGDVHSYGPTTQRFYLWTQIFATLAVSMGSLIVGFSSGYTSPALNSMNETLSLTKDEGSWVGGLMPLAALMGGIAGGPLIDYAGRKLTIMCISVPFFIGWMLIANAAKVTLVFVGRVFCGVCVGIGSLAFPVYVGETVQPEVRGALGLLPTAFGNIGILLVFFAGKYLNWSNLAFLGAALPVPVLLLMILAPETPRWYVSKGRAEEARKSLQWLRGKNVDTEKEMSDLMRSQDESDLTKGSNTFRQLFSKKYLPAVLISLGLMLFQQLSGINAVIYYSSDFFSFAGSTLDKNMCSIIIGVVNFASTFIATGIIDRLGRKMLLYISSVSMITTLTVLGSYLYLKDVHVNVSGYGWLPLACLMMYVLGFSIGFGPIPWLMLGEILPSRIRGTAASLATGLNFACTFIITTSFHKIVDWINMSGAMWLYAAVCLLGLLFVIFFVPETKGKSLEEIEKKLTGDSRRVRRHSSNKPTINGC